MRKIQGDTPEQVRRSIHLPPDFPTIICLVGSTRFRKDYEDAFRKLEHAGFIVLTVPCYKNDPCCKTEREQAKLDRLHRYKIDLSDSLFVINGVRYHCSLHDAWWDESGLCPRCPVSGKPTHSLVPMPYIGESTRREIAYATAHGKVIRYLNSEGGK